MNISSSSETRDSNRDVRSFLDPEEDEEGLLALRRWETNGVWVGVLVVVLEEEVAGILREENDDEAVDEADFLVLRRLET